jgi:putative transposase
MRKKREFISGKTYHVTSRTNNKNRVFSRYLGQRIMLLVIRDAKEKYQFKLHNFSIMPTHIHLLITPADKTNLSRIIQWIKTMSAKRWNKIHGHTDHLWGSRFYARQVKNLLDYYIINNYIDLNPVKAGLANYPADYKPTGAYQISRNIISLVDFTPIDRQVYIKLLPSP